MKIGFDSGNEEPLQIRLNRSIGIFIWIYIQINGFWSIKMRILETGDMRVSVIYPNCRYRNLIS